MSRTIATIQLALQLATPQLQPRAQVAAELSRLEREHQVDSLTIVAVIERESGGKADAVGKAGEIGLGQIMPSNFPSCREDPQGADCAGIKRLMLDWRMNLGMTAGLMEIMRTYCRNTVGSALAIYWLQEYQGHRGTCGHVKRKGRWVALPVPKGVTAVMKRRRELARRFG